jgi:4-hydroxythreonine-4-phosphate dehydrogenase
MPAGASTPLVLTMGEPAGIGGELTLLAWLARETQKVPPFVVIDSPLRLERLAARLGWDVPITVVDKAAAAVSTFSSALPVLAIPVPNIDCAGEPDAANGSAVLASIRHAVALAQSGAVGAIVTNPIHKAALYAAGFGFPGHTEFLASLDATDGQPAPEPVMMLAGPELRVVPVTIHVALAEAVRQLNTDTILRQGRIAAAALRRDFGLAAPRIAVAGLNPHAGEAGSMGREDIDIIAPAIAALRAEGIDAVGPMPPDTMFHAAARKRYDLALCMYHDQALIPLKTLDFDRGVNVTLGLSFVRTSPDHGTALDIAGTGTANPTSLLAALQLAGTLATNRANRR